jgi:hypothetical protein
MAFSQHLPVAIRRLGMDQVIRFSLTCPQLTSNLLCVSFWVLGQGEESTPTPSARSWAGQNATSPVSRDGLTGSLLVRFQGPDVLTGSLVLLQSLLVGGIMRFQCQCSTLCFCCLIRLSGLEVGCG